MKNKYGKTSPFVWVILAVVVLAILYFTVGQSTLNLPGGSSDSGCNIAPSVNVLAKNTLVTGTTPSLASNNSIYDGSYIGAIPSNLAKGKSLDVLATATNYMNSEGRVGSLNCGTNDLTVEFTPYTAPTYIILDASYNTLTDNAAGGAVNESSSANQITDTVKISGTPDKTTGEMLFTVDFANKTEVASNHIDLSGGKRVSNPTWFTPAGTGSAIASFVVPAIVDGGSKTYDLTFTPESGQTIGAGGTAVYTTIYVLEPVILDTQSGTFQTSNTWEDSLGADKTKANVDYDIYIV